MSRPQPVRTTAAPGAIGPYNQAIISEGLVFTSGQIGLDPATGTMVGKGVVEQAERALKNLAAVLGKAGCSMHDVVKTTVYLRDMKDYPVVNEVYAKVFTGVAPARAAMAVAGLPMDARVEIDAVARRP